MLTGDIVIINNKIFLAYDKSLILGMNLSGPFLIPVKSYLPRFTVDVYRLKIDTGYSKKKKMSDFIMEYITKKPSIKERINFHKIINHFYEDIFKTSLLPHRANKVTIANMLNSEEIERIPLDA